MYLAVILEDKNIEQWYNFLNDTMLNKNNKLIKRYKARIKRARKKRFSLYDKHYFQLKGKNAEAVLNELAQKTFLTDWCYLNPKLPDEKELCDLLVVFDDIAIIWQLKDVKLKNDQIKESDFNKNIKQISGAYRQLFEIKTEIELVNPRRGKEKFDPGRIKNVYLISVFFGDNPFRLMSMIDIKGKYVHTFTRHSIQIILNELDTISDFTKYLKDIEDFRKQTKAVIIDGGAEELLGYYVKNNRNFDGVLKQHSDIGLYVQGGHWENLIRRKEYIAKQKENKISYAWDYLIDICHTGDNPEYEPIARKMAIHNRFERRILAQTFIEAHEKAESVQNGMSYRRATTSNGITYCFLFYGYSGDKEQREIRKTQLFVFCFIARGQLKNKEVIGIATDQYVKPDIAFDYCYIDKPEWTQEDQKIMENDMRETGIFTKMDATHKQFFEFPKNE
ncbi:MAG: hypothetical protein NTW93_02950 [Phycisphaerae bacterium]|nr:hypothetical protein [Phycisphaerae bacterium]